MSHRAAAVAALLVLLLLVLASLLWFADGAPPSPAPAGAAAGAAGSEAAGGALGAARADAAEGQAARRDLAGAVAPTGVRGIVLDAGDGRPLGGIEVLALADEPSLEPLVNRFRGLFQGGMFTETRSPARVLGRTLSQPDGTFELLGLRDGLVFLDGRSDGHFVRTPASVRLATGETVEGIELRAQPGGRVRGVVLGVDGAPVEGASVSLRPGLNAFLGQLTERRYRWLETTTGKDGRFDLPGVPPGNGYVVSATADVIALEEVFGVDVRPGQVREVVLRGHPGATVAGRVFDADGATVAGASVAMVYLDISRVLFSADGRSEPIVTDEQGGFRVRPVAAGRVAFVAALDGCAPSGIEELAVVDGGVYEALELHLGAGATVRGLVVDDLDQPVSGARVELRPFERPDDPQFLKMLLRIRRIEVETGADGRFAAHGMTGERLVVQAGKPGYTTAVRFGVRLDEEDLRVQIQRGATVRGRALLADGTPVGRFRVDTRSRPPRRPAGDGGQVGEGEGEALGDPAEEAAAGREDDRAARFEMRFGAGGGRGRFRGGRSGTVQLPEGETMVDRMDMDGNWREIAAADGTFELRGIPPGRIRVRARADGLLDPDEHEVELQPGQASELLEFTFAPGLEVTGVVRDATTDQPVCDAQVTAYRQREGDGRRGSGPFRLDMDREDMDFLALSSTRGRRSAITDSRGQFRIGSLNAGTYRFTARHPDMAKASARDVEVTADRPVPPVEILIGAGGAIEGHATGQGMRPLADAVIAAFSMQSGTLRSAATDRQGFYRIDGLPPGQYAVFKSRMDERADNIPLELLGNLRLKTTTVRDGRTSTLDIHDESEDGVRVHGVVRENGKPVPRALVTLLGTDREGFLGMGVRANAADSAGRYELAGIAPGDYVVQVSRFQGRPVQTTFPLEVPGEMRDFAFDIDLPTSAVAGRVIDTAGNPVRGIRVALGSTDQGLSGADGLVGLIAQGGLSQGRTDEDGGFRLRSVAAGSYRLTAGSRMGGGRRRGGGSGGDSFRYGEAALEGIEVDGFTDVEGLVVTVPLAGRITGIVIDGSGLPVRGAEIAWASTATEPRRPGSPLLDLFGTQSRPITTGEDGRFEVAGLNPGTYDLRVDSEALEAGRLQDVSVAENSATDVTLHIVRGAVLRVRATNVEKANIPIAHVSLLDGQGRTVVNKVSTLSVMRRLFANRDSIADSGWYEFGSVPPDTYTIVVAEPGKPEVRVTRTITDGETVEWDIDVTAELARHRER